MSETGHIAATILRRARGRTRFLTAIAGAPASGKSTLAEALREAITGAGETAAVIPMDGFHYDDAVLKARGHRERKGAPHTFDFMGFRHLLERLRSGDEETAIPVFDRDLEISRAGAAIVPAQTRFLLVEGNYLLFDEAPWNGLDGLFDFSLFLDIPTNELERRLAERWRLHGKGDDEARRWIAGNDLPNIEAVTAKRRPADLVLTFQPA